MASLFGLFPFLLKLYADSGYQGPTFQQGLSRVRAQVNVEIVKRSDAGRFVVLPKRWIGYTEAMSLHLAEISDRGTPGRHCAPLMAWPRPRSSSPTLRDRLERAVSGGLRCKDCLL